MIELHIHDEGLSALLLDFPCRLSITELQETSRKNIAFLLEKHPEEDFPLIHTHLKKLFGALETLTDTWSDLGNLLWQFHIYLSFFCNTNHPLHPKTKTEKDFLSHIYELYRLHFGRMP